MSAYIIRFLDEDTPFKEFYPIDGDSIEDVIFRFKTVYPLRVVEQVFEKVWDEDDGEYEPTT